ncbi:MAG: NADH-quinone oxidoreductase subunit H [Victivallales bacterium]|nr:NADH-quinone oxidoreductase subunit H [Victivallales bacterium]
MADTRTMAFNLLPLLCGLILAPFMIGVVNRTKAFFAGRNGQPLFQLYFDIFKLLRKGAVISRSTTWVFRGAPAVSLASIVFALAIFSFSQEGAALSFPGDIILAVYMLALARFATVLSALDTGSSFEGMGASREVMLAPFAEAAFLILILAAAAASGSISAATMFSAAVPLPVRILMFVSLFIVLLVENCRVPADDPNTHLELTMIHEVMVLDNSGPDLGMIFYAASLKLWLFASLTVCCIMPAGLTGSVAGDIAMRVAGVFCVSVLVGVVESVMARFRFDKVRRMLLFASALSSLALLIALGATA